MSHATPPRRINIHHQSSSPLLPLSHGPSSPSASTSSRNNLRSTTRRISYTLKNRANRYAYPLGLSAIIALLFLYHTYAHSSILSPAASLPRTNGGKLHLYTRDDEEGHHAHGHGNNGIGLLMQDEEELIAEDDLFWQSYEEPPTLSKAEKNEAAELKAHKLDVERRHRQSALQSLVWWLAEGGILPQKWEVPAKKGMLLGGRGALEGVLDAVQSEGEDPGETIFQEGWAEYAQKQYRIVVFSKSYCPYSRRAKKILESYRLTPAPFIIELDRRTDMDHLQTLLQRLTGRRTVPNILLDFESVGGSDDLTLLDGEGQLQTLFEEMGVLPGFRSNLSPLRGAAIRDREQPAPVKAKDIDADAGKGGGTPPHEMAEPVQREPVLPQQPPKGPGGDGMDRERERDHGDVAGRHGAGVERVEKGLDREVVAGRHADGDGMGRGLAKRAMAEQVEQVTQSVPASLSGEGEVDGEMQDSDDARDEAAQLEKLRTRLEGLEALAKGKVERLEVEAEA